VYSTEKFVTILTLFMLLLKHVIVRYLFTIKLLRVSVQGCLLVTEA